MMFRQSCHVHLLPLVLFQGGVGVEAAEAEAVDDRSPEHSWELERALSRIARSQVVDSPSPWWREGVVPSHPRVGVGPEIDDHALDDPVLVKEEEEEESSSASRSATTADGENTGDGENTTTTTDRRVLLDFLETWTTWGKPEPKYALLTWFSGIFIFVMYHICCPSEDQIQIRVRAALEGELELDMESDDEQESAASPTSSGSEAITSSHTPKRWMLTPGPVRDSSSSSPPGRWVRVPWAPSLPLKQHHERMSRRETDEPDAQAHAPRLRPSSPWPKTTKL